MEVEHKAGGRRAESPLSAISFLRGWAEAVRAAGEDNAADARSREDRKNSTVYLNIRIVCA